MHRVPTRPSSRGLAALAALVLPLALVACGSDEPDSGADGTQEPVAIEITVEDGAITPKGDRIEVGVGDEVVFTVTSDVAGSVHVHSTPEATFDYTEGTTEETLTFERPGVVEVEAHDPDQLIVQLEVS
ncbi:hypothetical protein NOK12_01820 [Nocardioides sp. OK12]|uniref:hypothetical protein n=1 Tax=Nocardioides sp. OK12 TaxID=2758661 RepID=UPI0021C37FBE|nr:hypothetical protein [Nocardioides sp. OK12]GHJ57663.1 hypothetical protein NOK12_01820 [Nocardioides sp. OK12]